VLTVQDTWATSHFIILLSKLVKKTRIFDYNQIWNPIYIGHFECELDYHKIFWKFQTGIYKFKEIIIFIWTLLISDDTTFEMKVILITQFNDQYIL